MYTQTLTHAHTNHTHIPQVCKSCVWIMCVCESCVWIMCVCESCVWIMCVCESCVWVMCVNVCVNDVWMMCVCECDVCVWMMCEWCDTLKRYERNGEKYVKKKINHTHLHPSFAVIITLSHFLRVDTASSSSSSSTFNRLSFFLLEENTPIALCIPAVCPILSGSIHTRDRFQMPVRLDQWIKFR